MGNYVAYELFNYRRYYAMSNSKEFIHFQKDSILFPWGEQEVIGDFKCPICGKPIYVLEFFGGEKEHYYYLYHFNSWDDKKLCPIAQDECSTPFTILGGITYDNFEEIVDTWECGIRTVECTE